MVTHPSSEAPLWFLDGAAQAKGQARNASSELLAPSPRPVLWEGRVQSLMTVRRAQITKPP